MGRGIVRRQAHRGFCRGQGRCRIIQAEAGLGQQALGFEHVRRTVRGLLRSLGGRRHLPDLVAQARQDIPGVGVGRIQRQRGFVGGCGLGVVALVEVQAAQEQVGCRVALRQPGRCFLGGNGAVQVAGLCLDQAGQEVRGRVLRCERGGLAIFGQGRLQLALPVIRIAEAPVRGGRLRPQARGLLVSGNGLGIPAGAHVGIAQGELQGVGVRTLLRQCSLYEVDGPLAGLGCCALLA